METVTLRQFGKSPAKYIRLALKGKPIAITENGYPVAIVSKFPGRWGQGTMRRKRRGKTSTNIRAIRDKQEVQKVLATVEREYEKGRISLENCFLSKLEPIDLGYTDSSRLDEEIYRR